MNSMLGRGGSSCTTSVPFNSAQFSTFFREKTDVIAQSTSLAAAPAITHTAATCFSEFQVVSAADMNRLILDAANKSCALDPLPTWLLKQCSLTFAPLLAYLSNRSFNEGYFPSSQKHALVTPLIKKNNLDKCELKNYRPISNLSFTSKLIERAASRQLTQYLETNQLLPHCQSAYRRFHSTETAILKVYSDIVDMIDGGEVVLLGMLDLSAAFDTVEHSILLERLCKTHGIQDTALSWITSYLINRTQAVVANGERSEVEVLIRGVPQGSVLGPLLFLLYTTQIEEIVHAHNLLTHAYADDGQLYFHCRPDAVDQLTGRVLSCISDIHEWLTSNRLKMNPDKTEFIWFASRQRLQQVVQQNLSVNQVDIAPSRVVRNLGVLMDNCLTLTDHVTKTVQSCFYQLRQLKHVKRRVTGDNFKALLHAFVTSRVDYCNSVLYGQPAALLNRLQSVLNAAARLYVGISRRSSITEVLRELHWLRVPERIAYKLCLIVYRCLHGTAPVYLRDCCIRLSDCSERIASNRSAASGNLHVPRTHTATYGSRSFRSSGPSCWNKLPRQLKTADVSLPSFKQQLKTHLFSVSF
jgi:hypothetical protein